MSDTSQPGLHGSADHHDGIVEEDNKLPRWWLATLFVAMGFSFIYWQYYHVMNAGHTALQEWAEERAEHDKALAEKTGEVTDALLVQLSQGPSVQAGANTFKTTCAACHGEHAEGKIGPNLTDAYWLHGGKPTDIYRTVTNGWPLKGMPTWKDSLGPTKIKEVVAYVLTLRGTNVPGKAPEGEEYKPEGAPAAPAAAPSPLPTGAVVPSGEPHASAAEQSSPTVN